MTFALLFAIVSASEGVGHPDLPPGGVLIVEGVPGEVGEISLGDFERAFVQTSAVKFHGRREPPKPGETAYPGLKKRTLEILVDRAWVVGQAEESGLSAAPEEISATIARHRQEGFSSDREYREFQRVAHLAPADLNLQAKVEILTGKLEEALTDVPQPSEAEVEAYYEAAKSTQFAVPGEEGGRVRSLTEVESEIRSRLELLAQREAAERFAADYTATWSARTLCAPDYTIAQCSNGASGHPPSVAPGCYEADPKGGPPDACPAPVTQLVPALPGSVSPLAPKGEALPQRPRPAAPETA